MKYQALIAAAALVVVVGVSGTEAAEESDFLIDDTTALGKLCGAKPGEPNYMEAIHMCQGYMIGVHHFHTALAAELGEDIYCSENVEPRPTRDEFMAAFAGWVATTPDAGSEEALNGLLRWASEAFPCE